MHLTMALLSLGLLTFFTPCSATMSARLYAGVSLNSTIFNLNHSSVTSSASTPNTLGVSTSSASSTVCHIVTSWTAHACPLVCERDDCEYSITATTTVSASIVACLSTPAVTSLLPCLIACSFDTCGTPTMTTTHPQACATTGVPSPASDLQRVQATGCSVVTLYGGQDQITTTKCNAARTSCVPCIGCNAPQC
ncbi:hypothetical protein BAUCODRAFT_32728 [Baudoinia panamericana UAMH 10762]|uniref:Uncharacterized protein n=1 Tax=Baudoinia panamericana (strain UAMH 10762) TaxID=717646 RepID=M2MZE9_BAUPA|nr:uncharacterized protein BAUCODRAFT_32728 [Baudoinia panamericana UAMH 10762]EMC96983.1 hypothetical protein BAUCODRAFT_32728 [Baudoinia panamericana UAMH 10762]